MEETDPLETVRVLRSDLELLQKVAGYAVEDTMALGELLGLTCPEGMAPREFFHTICLQKIAGLLDTQAYVDEATRDLRVAAQRFGNKEIDLGGGRKGIKVGQRITDPEALQRIGLLPTRAERRRAARDIRRGE